MPAVGVPLLRLIQQNVHRAAERRLHGAFRARHVLPVETRVAGGDDALAGGKGLHAATLLRLTSLLDTLIALPSSPQDGPHSTSAASGTASSTPQGDRSGVTRISPTCRATCSAASS